VLSALLYHIYFPSPLLLFCQLLHLPSILLAEELSSIYHVGEGSLRLHPLPGLQTAVRVDPELIWSKVLEHLFDAVLDLLFTRNTRRMDIVDTRPDVAGIGFIHKDLKQLRITLTILNAEDIRVKSRNGVEEILKNSE